MTRTFLKSTAAAALLLLSMGAQADVVKIDFEGLGASGTEAPAAGAKVSDFSFAGAYAYSFSKLIPSDTAPSDASPGSGATLDGFIMNRARGASASDEVVLTLTGKYQGWYFKTLTFNLFATNGSTPFVVAYDAKNVETERFTNFVAGNDDWATAALDFGQTGQATSLRFGTTINSVPDSRGVLGLDNFDIGLAKSDIGNGGGTAPEPASYALVALALLAAGGASRRRKA